MQALPPSAVEYPIPESADISADELKARWAYSELRSSRQSHNYSAVLSPSIRNMAKQSQPFEIVGRAHWGELIAALHRVRGTKFADTVQRCSEGRYRREFWTPSALLSCRTLPEYNWVPFFSFLAQPICRDADGKARRDDPRTASNTIQADVAFNPAEAAIAVRVGGQLVLIDGYLRAIVWLRHPENPFPVWTPAI